MAHDIPNVDLMRRSNNFRYIATPKSHTCDTTGCVIGPLTAGRWTIASAIDCYWTRGDSTIAVTDVLVDESSENGTSNAIFAKSFIDIDVIVDSDEYLAFKSPSGGDTGRITVMCQMEYNK